MNTPDTRIAIKNDTQLDAYLDGGVSPIEIDGADELDRSDVQIPRLELVQAQSDMPDANKHLGEWYNTLTGEFQPTVTAILLSLAKGRTAFPRKFARDSKPLCVSDDGVTPRRDYIGKTILDDLTKREYTIDGVCDACPLGMFGENGETPLCAKSYTYAMIDANTGYPFVVRMQRTGMSVAKQINAVAKMSGRRRLLVLTSKHVRSDQGSYYVPVFSLGGPTPSDLLQEAFKLSAELGNIASRVQTENVSMNGTSAAAETEDGLPF